MADSKWGFLRPPFSMSLMRVDCFMLSFPFQMKIKIILFASIIRALCMQTKPALYIRIGTANLNLSQNC